MKNFFSMLLVTTLATMTRATETKYAVFVVDDTSSMAEEIGAVKAWIENCVSGDQKQCKNVDKFVLTTFNDPTLGDVIGPTNSEKIIEALGLISVNGGGDCPEMMYEGIENALSVIPPRSGVSNPDVRCKVFLFTDATAKSETKLSTVAIDMLNKGCALVPILTDCCGKCPNVCDSVSKEYCINQVTDLSTTSGTTDSSYSDATAKLYKLAEKTGGSIFVLNKPKNVGELLKTLKEKVSLRFCDSETIAKGISCKAACESRKWCWDKSVGKCFCSGRKCAGVTSIASECNPASVPASVFEGKYLEAWESELCANHSRSWYYRIHISETNPSYK